MNRLQRGHRLALATLAALVTMASLDAQTLTLPRSTSSNDRTNDRLPRRGVFEQLEGDERTSPPSAADRRIQWLTFYLVYADEVLSRYAPGGAAGARFDLFQFAGFPDGEPFGYPIHIVVTDRRTTLVGVVNTEADKALAELRAREAPGVVDVRNALVVAQ